MVDLLIRAPIVLCALFGGLARVAWELWRGKDNSQSITVATKAYLALMTVSLFAGIVVNEFLMASGLWTGYGKVLTLVAGFAFDDAVFMVKRLVSRYAEHKFNLLVKRDEQSAKESKDD